MGLKSELFSASPCKSKHNPPVENYTIPLFEPLIFPKACSIIKAATSPDLPAGLPATGGKALPLTLHLYQIDAAGKAFYFTRSTTLPLAWVTETFH